MDSDLKSLSNFDDRKLKGGWAWLQAVQVRWGGGGSAAGPPGPPQVLRKGLWTAGSRPTGGPSFRSTVLRVVQEYYRVFRSRVQQQPQFHFFCFSPLFFILLHTPHTWTAIAIYYHMAARPGAQVVEMVAHRSRSRRWRTLSTEEQGDPPVQEPDQGTRQDIVVTRVFSCHGRRRTTTALRCIATLLCFPGIVLFCAALAKQVRHFAVEHDFANEAVPGSTLQQSPSPSTLVLSPPSSWPAFMAPPSPMEPILGWEAPAFPGSHERAPIPTPPLSPPSAPPSPPACAHQPSLCRRRTAFEVASRLSGRFERGTPSSDVRAAGVFVAQWDAMHSPSRRWLPCQPDDWCYWIGNHSRFAGSVINRQLPLLWDTKLPGFVVAPAAVSLRCAFSADSSTQHVGDTCPRTSLLEPEPRTAAGPLCILDR